MNKLWYLSKIDIFEVLSDADLEEIDRMAPMTHFKDIKKGTVLQSPEEGESGLFFIKKGKVRCYRLHEDGKQFTASILGPGNVFGKMNSFSFGTSDLYVETMDETLICSVLQDDFEQFLLKRPQLAIRMLKELSDRLQEREELLEKLALGDLRDRTLYLFHKLASQFGIQEEDYHRIDVPLSHQEIANMIGATRESVSVLMKELAQEGLIKTGRQKVWLLNEAMQTS
ncbi:Crp/Fnr family transcriptional regulator [Marinicrinis sediminis]|uniref:Crp/Fnr family transcriptional regulator n=1 Tax=Marinicrinis sediminis TaxID=1652465 RepID=A0ABW5RGN7_9BACL